MLYQPSRACPSRTCSRSTRRGRSEPRSASNSRRGAGASSADPWPWASGGTQVMVCQLNETSPATNAQRCARRMMMMREYQRVATFRSGEVEVSAGDFWRVLLDWDKIMSWMPTDPAPVIMERVELAPGHRLGQVPCTRNTYFDPNKLPPDVPRDIHPDMVLGTLHNFDEEARMIV